MNTASTRLHTRAFWLTSILASGAAAGLALLGGCGGGSESAAARAPESVAAFAVGRTSIDWHDPTRAEQCGDARGGTARHLQATVWYPAVPPRGATPAPLLPLATLTLVSMTQGVDPTALARLPSRSHEEAPLATTRGPLPVLLMSHALGSASPLVYGSTAEALAARGYVVVGISHTFDALATFFRDGGVAFRDLGCGLSTEPKMEGLPAGYAGMAVTRRHYESMDAYLARDLDSALEQLDHMNATDATFAGRLQLQRVGVFGHSFGGSHAFRALRDNARVAAAANIDGGLFTADFASGVNKPYLSISSADTSPTPSQMARTVDRLTDQGLNADEAAIVMRWNLSLRPAFQASSPAYHVFLPMALHGNFTDEGMWDAWGVEADAETINVPDAQAILGLQNAVLARFFDRHVRGLAVTVALPPTRLRGATLEVR